MSTGCWDIDGLTDSPEYAARDRSHEMDMPPVFDPVADAHWAARDRWLDADPGLVDEVIRP